MYKKVSTDLNFVAREHETLEFWKEHRVFEKSVETREGHPIYMFYDGPPTANGKPHIGHVLTRVIKDMIPRYRTMKGYLVPRKAGWDTHGLPVELEVEKEIGISGKDQIEAYGLEPFINKCKESVWQYKGMWEDFSGKVGFWADMDNPYVTYYDDYIESEWWALKTIWDKGLLYKGFKVVPYCPSCGTPLSSHEVAQGYKTVKERSAVVRFKVKGEDAYFLAWTTTPWTLPSNIGLCVNPDEEYAKVKAADGYTYYMASALLDTVLGRLASEDQPAYEVLETMTGRDLEYKEYEPLFDFIPPVVERQHKKAFFVYCDSYVTMTDGTGIVHIAPAFGEDDARVGRKYDAPFVQMVDDHGLMKEETPYAGLFVKDADAKILVDLEARGQLFDAPKFEHDYPHCWRCNTPLIYYARESWFIKMTAVKDRLVENNKQINWIPRAIGEGRFGNWLENIQDWGISRNRYWGTPLNIWECSGCGHQVCVGSRKEMAELSGNPDDEKVELHRPYVDNVKIPCPCCGKEMSRVPEVIDCWFDSGAMPYAQLHYPFENKDLFEQEFPAEFISEAVDQTRGWFYSLHAESTLLFDKPAYKNVIVLGLVLDQNGEKMSKSKGNAVDPFDALEKYGADAIRWYFYTNSAPWLPSRFYDQAVKECQRKFLGTLWNTYAFYSLYAEIDQFNPYCYKLDEEHLSIMDKWLLSKLNTLITVVDGHLWNYRIPEAAKALEDFVDELSNWYVRRGRERYWGKEMTPDKINAYLTLHQALVTVAKLAAPMIPFMADEIYGNLVAGLDLEAPESVHLCDYPVADESRVDPALEEAMEEILRIVADGRACRNDAAIKNRQPLARMFVKADKPALSEAYTAIIRDELNVKDVVYTNSVRDFTTYTFKPQLRTVGPKYGKLLGKIRQWLQTLDGNAAMDELEANGRIETSFDGASVVLSKDDLLIESANMPGFVASNDGDLTVVLDTNLNEELLAEGFVREVTSKLQTMRKEAGFEVTDHILVTYSGTAKADQLIADHVSEIASEVLAEGVTRGEAPAGAYTKEWNVNGEMVTFSVRKLN
ncbi:MAG: isoleucine--tRNA ligase [Firmicutes bacterium]|nr:isoleucine--tRNA ligase [Bacillota bacterium]